MDFQQIFGVPRDIFRPPRLRADIIVRQDPARREEKRKARPGFLIGRDIVGHHELALSAHKAINMHDGEPSGAASLTGHCSEPSSSSRSNDDACKGWRQAGNLIHDFAWVGVVPVQPHGLGQALRDFPIFQTVEWCHHLADRLDPTFGIGEGAILFKKGRTRQEDMGVIRRFIEEQIMDDHAFHRRQPRRDMVRYWGLTGGYPRPDNKAP